MPACSQPVCLSGRLPACISFYASIHNPYIRLSDCLRYGQSCSEKVQKFQQFKLMLEISLQTGPVNQIYLHHLEAHFPPLSESASNFGMLGLLFNGRVVRLEKHKPPSVQSRNDIYAPALTFVCINQKHKTIHSIPKQKSPSSALSECDPSACSDYRANVMRMYLIRAGGLRIKGAGTTLRGVGRLKFGKSRHTTNSLRPTRECFPSRRNHLLFSRQWSGCAGERPFLRPARARAD